MSTGQMVQRVNSVDVFAQMDGVGVVCRMQRQCRLVVVDCNIGRPAQGVLDPRAGTAATGEAVHDQGAGFVGRGPVVKFEERRAVHGPSFR